MHKDRVAEFIFSLAMPADRAAGMIGDLMEDFEGRTFQFWTYVLRTQLTYVLRTFVTEPFQLLFGAALGWLGYLIISGFFAFIAYLILTLTWGFSYFFVHHTGLDLLTNLAKVRIDWYPPPDWLAHGIGETIKWIIVPLQFGRSLAKSSPGKELAAIMAAMIVWPLIAIVTKTPIWEVPLIQMTVLLGVLWQRWNTTRITA